MWIYNHSNGTFSKDGQVAGQGYSGFGVGKNNPALQNLHDVGDIFFVDLVEARDRAAIVARAARLQQGEARAREERLRVLLQPAFRRHRDDERAHVAPPIAASRSTQTANPTAGIGSRAPSRESSPS